MICTFAHYIETLSVTKACRKKLRENIEQCTFKFGTQTFWDINLTSLLTTHKLLHLETYSDFGGQRGL